MTDDDVLDALRLAVADVAADLEDDARERAPVDAGGVASIFKHGTLGIPASVDRADLPSGYVSHLEFENGSLIRYRRSGGRLRAGDEAGENIVAVPRADDLDVEAVIDELTEGGRDV